MNTARADEPTAGWELQLELRKLDRRKTLSVLLMTSSTRFWRDNLRPGFTAYCPLCYWSMNILISAIQQHGRYLGCLSTCWGLNIKAAFIHFLTRTSCKHKTDTDFRSCCGQHVRKQLSTSTSSRYRATWSFMWSHVCVTWQMSPVFSLF